MPAPKAEISACTSVLAITRSMRAFSTFRILPRIGRMAWVIGSRPPLAEPPALSPSTMKISHLLGSLDWQSLSLPGSELDSSRPLRGVALQPVAERVGDDALHEALGLGVAQLGLGLSLELRLAELDRDDRGQALADVVTGDPVLGLLHQAPLEAPGVDQRGERRPEALLVGAALVGVDRVGEGVDRLGVRRVPLHRDLEAHVALDGLGGLGVERDDRRVRDRLASVEVLDVVDQAPVVLEDLLDPARLG